MKHVGDITKLKGNELPIVDIVTGGSPCQDLSVAGKRAGLAGERSGLFMEQIRLIKEMRDECTRQIQLRGTDEPIRPRYMVWENVPGAFSSNKGADFQAVLEETAKVAEGDASIPGPPGGKWPSAGAIMGNGWSIAWRVHDAQFWGVPQRRKRIALVADFGGDTAPEILFERKGVSGDSEQGEQTRQETTETIGRGANPSSYTLKMRGGREIDSKGHKAGKGPLVQTELSGTLGVSQDQTLITNVDAMALEVFHCTSESEKVQTLKARDYKDPQCVVYGISAYDSNAMKSSNPNSGVYVADTTRTLDNNGGNPACNQGGMMVVQGFDGYNQQSTGDVAMPLRSKSADSDHVPIVCLEGNGSRPSHKGDGYAESDTMYTLNSTEHHAVCVENGKKRTVYDWHRQDTRMTELKDVCVTAAAGWGAGGNNMPYVLEEIEKPQTYQKTTGALMASGYDKLGTQEAANDMYVVQSNWDGSQVAPTLTSNNAGGNQRMPDKDNFNAVLTYGLDRASFNQGANAQYDFRVEEEKIGTQVAKGPGVVCQSIVRRLTPMECERLQGYPDGWTDIGEWVDTKGKVHKDADSPRYKALGNSIALPFWQWMAVRMRAYLSYPCTMASLFDGIGGFPLVFSRCGVKPVWASEIEEFPIAVTKKHFPDM